LKPINARTKECTVTRYQEHEPAAYVLVWGLGLLFGAAPALVGLAFAVVGGGNMFLGTPDTPNDLLLFAAGAASIVGLVMTLVGIYQLVDLLDDLGRATLQHLRHQASLK